MTTERRDVHNVDSLCLLRTAMKGDIAVLNRITIELAFNKNDGGYQASFKNPIDRFIKVEKYYKLASEAAVVYGISKEEANNWLLKQQLNLAILTINRIDKNPELIRKFMLTLMDYDKNLPIFLLNTMLEPVMRQ